VTIYHPWESGTDNSPRWDEALEAVEVGEMAPYARRDLQHVEDASQRPTDAEYDRYLWLVETIKRVGCDEGAIYESHPFLVKDVLASSIQVAANEALLEIAEIAGAPEEECAEIEGWIRRGLQGLDESWDPTLGLYLDYDLQNRQPLRALTVAGFSPLIAGHLSHGRLEDLLATLDSPMFCGNPGLRRSLPPSTSPEDPGFHPLSYWRGPAWPVINWLLWWSLERAGELERAEHLRQESLMQLADGGFGEYFDPFTGHSLGSVDQSWTAAVALDWLASGAQAEARKAA
jgi:glucosylglycerate hydrolase